MTPSNQQTERAAAHAGSPADALADARRIESWAGEARVNLIRIAALIAFYGHHLLNVHVFRDPDAAGDFHYRATALVIAWSVAALLLHVCLSRRWVPPALKYIATAWDLVLVTAMAALAKDPRGPLALLYFPVIAAAPLRLSLALVWAATLGAMAGYLLLLGHYAYIAIGFDAYYMNPDLRVPRAHQVIVLLALGAAGLLAGQAVRQARRLVRGHPVAVESQRGE